MSAWLCSDKHIAVIADAIQKNVSLNHGLPQTTESIAQVLHIENIKSLVARYGEKEKGNQHFIEITNDAIIHARSLPWYAIINLMDSYAYQSCEHDTWETSDACKMIKTAKEKIIGDFIDKSCKDKYWVI